VTLTEVYRDLRKLAPGDRAWILERLSSSAKMKLARSLGADGALYEPTATAKSMRQLDALRAADVLDALYGEPTWVVWAILSAAPWSWRGKVLRGLAPNVRYELQSLDRQRTEMAPAVRQFLVRAFAERVGGGSGGARDVSRFEQLLRRFTGRAA
jgi:hypothetical protein